MKVLILLSAITLAFAKERVCGANQRYLECGTACPLTCDNYDNPPKICPAMCVSGCHCEVGYTKTRDGRCVRPEDCPARQNAVCGENQRYETCGSACPLTCDNYDNPPKICPAMCVIGCHCERGYVKTSDGRCVRPQECPARANPVCGENQHYSTCGTACPLTCDNYANPPKICPAMCVIGCHCEKGYVKTRDGRCVRPEECQARASLKTCLEKPESGMCKAYMPMWYYDAEAETCKKFIYGGCQGNSNRYATKEECMQNCGSVKRQSGSDVCSLPAEPGVCDAYFPRFFFDSESGECRIFVYGGCGENGNNFKTIEECQRVCA